MTAAVAVRPDLDLTLDSLEERMREARGNTEVQDVPVSAIDFNLTSGTPSIRLGSTEVPATETGLLAFGDMFGIPSAYMKRVGKEVGADLQEAILKAHRQAVPASALAVRFGAGGVNGVFEAGRPPLDPTRIVGVARNVLGEGVIQRVIDSSSEFAFDVHVPMGAETGVGGDASSKVEVPETLRGYSWVTKTAIDKHSKVGDVTCAGLRFGVDLKRGLAPWTQSWMMRIACTNGMETTDLGLRVDARGLTQDEVLAALQQNAGLAFARAQEQIAHFYRLREQRVDNPERVLNRLAGERGIPQRSLQRMLDLAPTAALPDNPTMFDLTNLITNLANDPSMRNDGGRLILERAGGAVINDEATRCSHCQAKGAHA